MNLLYIYVYISCPLYKISELLFFPVSSINALLILGQ